MITQFTVGCSRTINLGNFESVRIESSVTINVDEVTARDVKLFQELKDAAQQGLRKLLEETYRNQYADRKKIA